MKKLIIILIFLLTVSAQAVQVYEKGIGGYIEYGQSIEKIQASYKDKTSDIILLEPQYIVFTEINLHYVFQIWNIQLIPFASIKTWSAYDTNILKGSPFCDIYTVGSEVLWNDISIVLDYYCAHPVYSNEESWQVENYRMG